MTPSALLFAVFTAAMAAPLAEKGEHIAGAEVVDTIDHPEFQRLNVRLPDGRQLTIELAATPEPMGACSHHGLSLQPRWELLGVHDAQTEDQPAVVTELCARLEAQQAPAELRPPKSGDPDASDDSENPGRSPGEATPVTATSLTGPGEYTPGWLSGVVGLLGLLGILAAVTRGRSAWQGWSRSERVQVAGLTLLALAARAVLGLWSIVWAPSFGFGRLSASWGGSEVIPLYGGGFSALVSPFVSLLGNQPDHLFGVQLVLGTLAVPMVWGLVRLLTHDTPAGKTAPLAAGLFFAMLPGHVWLSTTEVMHIGLVTVELAAALLAVAFVSKAITRPGVGLVLALASALATGLALHIRPEAFPFILIPASWVVVRVQRSHRPGLVLAVAVVAGLAAPRLITLLLDVNPAESAVDYSRITEAASWVSFLLPTMADPAGLAVVNTATHPYYATPVLVPLALLGLFSARRPVAVWLTAWWVATISPIALKAWPLADALRLQLPALVPVVVLAGIGAGTLVSWLAARSGRPQDSVKLQSGLAVAIFAILLPHTLFARPAWGPIAEARHLIDTVDQIPETATVFYNDADIHASGMAGWAAAMRPGSRWRPMTMGTQGEPPSSPLMAWLGTSCEARPHNDEDANDSKHRRGDGLSPCARLREKCGLRPAAVIEVSGQTDIYLKDFDRPLEVGLYYVDDCQGPSEPSEPSAG